MPGEKYFSGLAARLLSVQLLFGTQSHRSRSIHPRFAPILALLSQSILVLFALLSSWLLRFDFSLPQRRLLFTLGPLLIAIRIAGIYLARLYRGWWRFSSVHEVVRIMETVGIGTVVFWAMISRVAPEWPRSVYIIEAILSIMCLCGIRLAFRLFRDSVRQDLKIGKRTLLIGAGTAANMFLHDAFRHKLGIWAVGLLDDDLSKHGVRLHGVPVLGSVDELPELVQKHAIDEVLITVPSATGAQMQQFTDLCNAANVPFKTVPAIAEILYGSASIRQIRDVRLEDLLGRDTAELDVESLDRELGEKTVLVTGAAGSIGSELCRQVLRFGPKMLVCLDQNENGLFYLQDDLRQHAGPVDVLFHVADVSQAQQIKPVFAEHPPDIVFHAAAYKHVPMMESNVRAAVGNNVLAFISLVEAAEEAGCKHFVLISSDKAVNPTNVMGATKRLCELILSSRPTPMCCTAVRFGNVLGSAGSVVPLMQKQLHRGDAVTVTHPNVRRFFMAISEAVGLVLQASTIAEHRDILVLDMGEEIYIVDLARKLARLSGKNEAQVEFIGLRPGEKLHEELFYPEEKVEKTTCPKINRAKGLPVQWSSLAEQLRTLCHLVESGTEREIYEQLQRVVPQFDSPSRHLQRPAAKGAAASVIAR